METGCISADLVRLALDTLLTTTDTDARSEANRWLSQTFRPSVEAWDLTLELLRGADTMNESEKNKLEEARLLGSQILFQKLNEDLGQLFHDNAKCLRLCHFLVSFCFDTLVCEESLPGSRIVSGFRARVSECLAVVLVSLQGAHWSAALTEVLSAGRQGFTHLQQTLAQEECLRRISLMHILTTVPELISSIETKGYLMRLLGHHVYTNWRKTKAAIYFQSQIPVVGDCIAETLRLAMNTLSVDAQQRGTQNVELLYACIREACTALIYWSRVFNCVMLTASPLFFSTRCVWDLLFLDARLPKDPVVPEMLSVMISRMDVPRIVAAQSTAAVSSDCGISCSVPSSFALTNLGDAAQLVAPVLAFLHSVVSPTLKFVTENDLMDKTAVPHAQQIESQGGAALVSFSYQWTNVVYHLAVMVPHLLASTSETPFSVTSSCASFCRTIEIPSTLLLQLIRLESRFHPHTHLKLMDLWQDLMDMRNDNLLSNDHIRYLLNELGLFTVRCMLLHCRRDNSIWDETESECSCADPGGRGAYKESCQDAIVSLYYLFQGVGERHAEELVVELSRQFQQYCAECDYAGSAVTLLLLDSVIESVVDPFTQNLKNVLNSLCDQMPLDPECVSIMAPLIQRQSVFFTDKNHGQLWTTFFNCLMRLFPVQPRLSTLGIYSLCDAGGELGLLQSQTAPSELIQKFCMYIEAVTQALPHVRHEFEDLLYGALACLIRRLPSGSAAELFAQCLEATTLAVQATLMRLPAVAPGADTASLWNSLVLLVKRVLRSLLALESKLSLGTADASNFRRSSTLDLRDLRELCVTRFLFKIPQNSTVIPWKTYCGAASVMLEHYSSLQQEPGRKRFCPAADCSSGKKAERHLWSANITPDTFVHLGTHLLRFFVNSVPVTYQSDFWNVVLQELPHRHLKGMPVNQLDGSLVYVISDVAKQLQKYETENLINETPAMQEKTAAVRLWWLDVVQSLVVPLMIMKSANTQLSDWSYYMKPFFQCAENAVAYWEFSRQWSANVVTDLIPVFIRGLQCTSYKIQKATWEALSRMLTSKDMNLRSIVLEFYGDFVKVFWLYCHVWDFRRITPAVSFVNALVRPLGDSTAPERFIHISRKVWEEWGAIASQAGTQDGVFKQLASEDIHAVLELFRVVRGIRLRQLLMDLIKVGKRLATPDCLMSYSFLLPNKAISIDKPVDLD